MIDIQVIYPIYPNRYITLPIHQCSWTWNPPRCPCRRRCTPWVSASTNLSTSSGALKLFSSPSRLFRENPGSILWRVLPYSLESNSRSISIGWSLPTAPGDPTLPSVFHRPSPFRWIWRQSQGIWTSMGSSHLLWNTLPVPPPSLCRSSGCSFRSLALAPLCLN